MDRLENFPLHEITEDIRNASESIPEEKLESAVRSGLERGKTLRRRRKLWFPAGIAAGAAACCLLLITLWQTAGQVDSSQTTVQGTPGIPEYVLAQMSSDMRTAADHGLYQPVNKSVEEDQYRVTVDGVLADNQRVVVFLTYKNLSSNGSMMDLKPGEIIGFDGKRVLNPTIYSSSTQNSAEKRKNTRHLYYTLSFKEEGSPSKLEFSGVLETSPETNAKPIEFEIPFEWDSSKYREMEDIIPVNQTAVIDGNKISISDIVLTPLSTMVRIDAIAQEDHGIGGLLEVKLLLGKKQPGQFLKSLLLRSSMSEQLTDGNLTLSQLYFDSIYYKDLKEVTLAASGIGVTTSEKIEVSIDTDKKKMISPNSMLHLLEVNNENNMTEIVLQHSKEDDDLILPLILQNDFNTGDGTQVTLEDAGNIEYSTNSLNNTIRFKLEVKDYPQPLTFKFGGTSIEEISHPIEFHIRLQ